jgi:DNA-binding winged helix-turn-helix (wHTH) protein
MTRSAPARVERRQGRRWSFADCVFDENCWSLDVGGERVAVEMKPLELLHELLLRANAIVTKEELLDRIWPGVVVVEASLPTAVRKLRLALADDQGDRALIETISGVGYRLAVPVAVEPAVPGTGAVPSLPPLHQSDGRAAPAGPAPLAQVRSGGMSARTPVLIAVALLLLVIIFRFGLKSPPIALGSGARMGSQNEAASALRRLDVPAIEALIAAGWDPSNPWDKEGNDALSMLLNRCEWDPAHDRRKMLLMARTLIEGGAPIDRRNVWGDTAYSIAKADRYCGPDHPVTQMLEAICYGGTMGPKDLCLATYELTPEQRRLQGLPPKN